MAKKEQAQRPAQPPQAAAFREPLPIHLRLGDMNLEGFVNKITDAVWGVLRSGEKGGRDGEELKRVLRESIRGVLKKHVVAFDLCGLSVYCQELEEVDPWETGSAP